MDNQIRCGCNAAGNLEGPFQEKPRPLSDSIRAGMIVIYDDLSCSVELSVEWYITFDSLQFGQIIRMPPLSGKRILFPLLGTHLDKDAVFYHVLGGGDHVISE